MLKFECDICSCDLAALLINGEGCITVRCMHCKQAEELDGVIAQVEIDGSWRVE